MNRREFLQTTSTLAAISAAPALFAADAPAANARKFTLALVPGSIGVSAKSQKELNDLARDGFSALGMTVGRTSLGGNELVVIARKRK